MDKKEYSVYSGGLKGAEETFGECAEKYGINEINFSFEGHKLSREKNVTILSDEELKRMSAFADFIDTLNLEDLGKDKS